MINSRDSVEDNFNERVYLIPFNIGTFITNNDTNEVFKVLEYIINSNGFSARIMYIEKDNIFGNGLFRKIDINNNGEEKLVLVSELTKNYKKSPFSYIVPKNINNGTFITKKR